MVNDLGGARDGVGGDLTPAQEVVAEIEAMGGEAIANGRRRVQLGRSGQHDQSGSGTLRHAACAC